MVAYHPDHENAKVYALLRLEKQLSPDLRYHSLDHTRDDVLPAALRLARYEGVSPSDVLLLETAVVYHDIGFTIQVDNHELISAQIAAEVLPSFGYSMEQIQIICGMILVTKLFTPPQTLLEAIMVDADLDVLGRKDFFSRNEDLRKEINLLGRLPSDAQWYDQQIKFMQTHRYRTISAQTLRNSCKNHNFDILFALFQACTRPPNLPLNGNYKNS